jgi:hypothetical protein
MAGQRPVRAWRTALLTCRGRAAAAIYSPAEPAGPSGTDDTGPSPTNDHAAWSPPPVQPPMVGHHAGNLPRTHLRGAGEHLGVLVPQPTDRHPGAGPAHLSARRQGGTAACGRVMRRPRSAGDPRASHPRPTQHHPFPSGPYAGRRPRRPRTTAARRTHCAQRGRPAAPSHSRVQPGADSTAAEPRTPEGRPSGHLDGTGRVDTGRVDTGRVDTGRVDTGRPRDRSTDVRTADRGRGQGDDRRGRRPDILATGDHSLGGQASPGSQRLGAPMTAPW